MEELFEGCVLLLIAQECCEDIHDLHEVVVEFFGTLEQQVMALAVGEDQSIEIKEVQFSITFRSHDRTDHHPD